MSSLPIQVGPATDSGIAGSPSRQAQPGSWDLWLLFTTVALAAFGLLMIFSASSVRADAMYGDATHFVTRQALALIGGIALAAVALTVPWGWFRAASWPLYILSLVGLGLVMTPLAHEANGAARWITVAGINVQPSEFAKVALILVLSHYLACNEGRLHDVVGTVLPAILIAAPAVVLVLAEPDFGTSVILVGLLGALLFVAGLRWIWVFGLGVVGSVGIAAVGLLEPYRLRRLISFADPFADKEGAGYQVVQGMVAMAHGSLTGMGFGTGQAQGGFLPEAHNDFIAAVVGEEFGAIGFTAMVFAQAILVWRGTVIASRARELYGMLVAMALTVLLGSQAAINLLVVVGWMPNKGLVLPFLSYGASAVMVHTLCAGILLRIALETPPEAPAPEGAP